MRKKERDHWFRSSLTLSSVLHFKSPHDDSYVSKAEARLKIN